MNDKMIKDAEEILKSGDAKVVIGFEKAYDGKSATPLFVTKPEDAARLQFDSECKNNLAVFLTQPEVKALGKPAIVATERGMMAVIALVQESQIAPEGVILLGVKAGSNGTPEYLGKMTVADAEKFISENFKALDLTEDEKKRIEQVEKMSQAERWDFWAKEFSKCIRCYACRQACPLCYCTRCIVEKNQPQWVSPNIAPRGNFSWNVARAHHLAGRCIGCGECERACPAGIPLMTLNRILAKEIYDDFGYLTGRSTLAKPPMATFKPDDKEDFIL
jgi:ferredoxin